MYCALRPEDYEPMPDDGLGFGDYPKLAKVSSDMKSDWEEWDDTYNKRNFGEPVSSAAQSRAAFVGTFTYLSNYLTFVLLVLI